MRIGIIGAIGVDDIGDIVMLEAGLKQLLEAARNKSTSIDFTVFALDVKKTIEQINKMNIHAKIKVVNSLKAENLAVTLQNEITFEDLLEKNFKSIIKDKEYIFNIEECDALFFIGGGYFNEYWGNRLLPTFIIPILIGYQLNKPVFISGVNIGPFSNELLKNLKGLFRNVDTITLRDRSPSIEVLDKLGGTEGKLILGADDILPIWYERKNYYNYPELEDQKSFAVIQLHHWVEMYSESYIEFYKTLSAFFDEILDKKVIEKIYFLPFTYFKGVDYECGRRLKTFINDRGEYVVLEPTDDHIFMRELIRESKFVIGSRYHPVVYALGENVPVLGIYVNDLYKQKISGAYDVLGIDKEHNMVYINAISTDTLMRWYEYAIEDNYSVDHNKKSDLISEYGFNRKKSIESFIERINMKNFVKEVEE